MILAFLFLTYFTLYDSLWVHPHLYKWPSFLPFCGIHSRLMKWQATDFSLQRGRRKQAKLAFRANPSHCLFCPAHLPTARRIFKMPMIHSLADQLSWNYIVWVCSKQGGMRNCSCLPMATTQGTDRMKRWRSYMRAGLKYIWYRFLSNWFVGKRKYCIFYKFITFRKWDSSFK